MLGGKFVLSVMLSELVGFVDAKCINPKDGKYLDIKIISDYVYRLGLELMTNHSSLSPGRIVVMGESERYFLSKMDEKQKRTSLDNIFSRKFAAIFISNSISPDKDILELSEKYSIPIFISSDKTSLLMSDLINFLEERLEPSITRPAGLMSIHGEGVLLTGESGIGKSEVALELIHRGHKFVSDDLTEIRKISTKTLMGSPPGNISKFIEVRGIGIINVQQLFGINAIKKSENIDMIVNFELWNDKNEYDRLGSIEYFVNILDIKVPYISIPVKPGKNLAVLVEVAAMNNRIKKYGMNPYGELMNNLCGISELIPKKFQEVFPIWDK